MVNTCASFLYICDIESFRLGSVVSWLDRADIGDCANAVERKGLGKEDVMRRAAFGRAGC